MSTSEQPLITAPCPLKPSAPLTRPVSLSTCDTRDISPPTALWIVDSSRSPELRAAALACSFDTSSPTFPLKISPLSSVPTCVEVLSTIVSEQYIAFLYESTSPNGSTVTGPTAPSDGGR